MIGGGIGGIVAAKTAVKIGAKVALIEQSLLGGECLSSVIVTKAFLKCANIAHTARLS